MIPLLPLFYAGITLAVTSTPLLIIGLLKREHEPQQTSQEEYRTPFQLGETNPAIKPSLQNTKKTEKQETPQEPPTEQTTETLESPEEWGERFRTENFDTTEEEKSEAATFDEAEPLEEQQASPSPPTQQTEKAPPQKKKKPICWEDLEPANEKDVGAFKIKIIDGIVIPTREDAKIAKTVESEMWVKLKPNTQIDETEGDFNFGT